MKDNNLIYNIIFETQQVIRGIYRVVLRTRNSVATLTLNYFK